VEDIVIEFIRKQLEASERLYRVMAEDNQLRAHNLQMWVDMTADYQKKLAERDAEIERLRSKLSQYEIGEKL
jgi:cell shape-determining protein MreC